jgi:hypothetical protein
MDQSERGIPVIIVLVVFIVVIGLAGGVLIARARPAARLRSGKARPAGASPVAAASAALAADDAATARFGLITRELFALPAPSSAPGDASEQLEDVADALARLDHAADCVERAGASLAALAVRAAAGRGTADGIDGSRAQALAAALADIAKMPADRTGPDDLAKVIARRAASAGTVAAAGTPASGDERGGSSMAARVRTALPADPHAEARAELLADLAALGLDSTWTDLGTWPEFARKRDGYDKRQLDLARDYARFVDAARASEMATVAGGEPGGHEMPSEEAEVHRLARDLCAATTAYAGRVRTLLGPGADRVPWLAAVPGLVARCEEQLRGGNLTAALSGLAAAPAPVVRSWPPSQEYSAAWQGLADRLEPYARQHRQQAAQRVADASARFRAGVTRLAVAADTGLAAWEAARDASWDGLQDAAAEVKRDAAAILAAPDTSRDAAEPVRAAVAVLAVDQVAAANAAQLVRRAFPEPGPVLPEGTDVDERLGAVKSLCMRLDKHSELLSGLDGALTPVLAAQFPVGPGLYGALTALTPVPADLAAGYKDALTFSHHMLAGVTWGGVGKAFVHQVSQGLLPGVGAPGPGAVFSGVSALVKGGGEHVQDAALNSMFHGSLLLSMLDADNPLVTGLGSTAGSAVSALAKQIAAHNPAVIDASQHLGDAAHHVAHAAGLAAPDALHAMLGHVPFVTLTLSSIREIQLLNDGVTTMGTSVRNITLDAAGVALGFAAGEVATHVALHAVLGAATGGASLIIGIPASIVGRKVFKGIKERPYRQAVERFEEVQGSYSATSLDAANGLESAARTVFAQHRRKYHRVHTAPPDTEHGAAEVARLTAELRTATAAYLRAVSDILAAGGGQGASTTQEPGTAFTRTLPANMLDCDAQLADGQYVAALLTLTESPLPAPATWRPAADYRQLCTTTATRIAELADGDRTNMARWATESAKLFQTHAERVSALVNAEAKSAEQKLSDAAAVVGEAEAVVRAEAAKLGKKKG